MWPGQISIALMTCPRKANQSSQGKPAFPPWHCLSPHQLPQQIPMARDMSPAALALPSTACLSAVGGHTAPPKPTPPLCSLAHRQLPRALPPHQGPQPGHNSLAASEELQLQGQEQPGLAGDTRSHQLTGTLFWGWRAATQSLFAIPQGKVVGPDPIPVRLGWWGEPGPGNSTHHA